MSELLGVISELETVNMTAELVLLPGTYNPTTHVLVRPLTMEMIRQVNATKVFIGADGLSLKAGVSAPDLEIAAIERSMIQQTRGQVIVMADHPKFGMVAEISIAPLKHINILTGSGSDQANLLTYHCFGSETLPKIALDGQFWGQNHCSKAIPVFHGISFSPIRLPASSPFLNRYNSLKRLFWRVKLAF